MSDYDVDLFVIGGGSGGVRAARIAAQHGARVMVAEEYRVGGTCVIRGCVPKKLLVYASRFRAEFEDAVGYGWTLPRSTFDWPTLIANKDREIARLEAAYTSTLAKAGVTIVKSRAVIADAHTVQLATGERVRAAYILIATGGTPSYGDPIPGIEHAISSNEAFYLPQFAAACGGPGGRLYRARIRRHLCRSRLARDRHLSRRKYFARLRRRSAGPRARGNGEARHQSRYRMQDRGNQTDRTNAFRCSSPTAFTRPPIA